jgi:putative ABC transport system permease protein
MGGVRLRFREGDDASCLNLNRAQEPRLVGVDGLEMAGLGAFGSEVWDLLALELPDGMVPGLVGDMDTAMWGLEARMGPEKGDVLVYPAEGGRELRVKLVGALPMRLSVFQGAVLIPERSFVASFPREGYRLFLLDAERDDLKGSLMQAYSRFGLEVVSTLERLQAFYTVETTYLVMFLVLGVMGLAVGSLGMGVVVLRNVQDRRSEWAILRAVGYDSAAVKKVLWLEHALLFGLGLGVGTMASAVAMVPAVGLSGSTVSLGRMSGLFLLVVFCGLISLSGAVAVALRGELMDGLRSE